MSVEIATGKAKCNDCGEPIPKGARCWHQRVNSRAYPYFCLSCIERMQRLISGKTKLVNYFIHTVDGVMMAVRDGQILESPDCKPIGIGRSAEQTWQVDLAKADEALKAEFGDKRVRWYGYDYDRANDHENVRRMVFHVEEEV